MSIQARRKKLGRFLRGSWYVAKAFASTRHPILAHLVVTRRCNLSCAYCNEYDKVSSPVDLEALQQRVDNLASRGISIITLSGGEPLLHPQLEEVVRHIRSRGVMATVITNGYLLTRKRIEQLNAAGLDYLQISIDNVEPDDVSKKSLKVLDGKLALLRQFAHFGIVINSVIGAGIRNPEDALTITGRARELGMGTSLGILHTDGGQAKPLDDRQQKIYRAIVGRRGPGILTRLDKFGRDLVRGQPHPWKCRAGARYVYVDEFGLVHWCSQQKGYPGVPLERYSSEDMRREYFTEKPCAAYCTVQCVRRISIVDSWRHRQTSPRRSRSVAR